MDRNDLHSYPCPIFKIIEEVKKELKEPKMYMKIRYVDHMELTE